MGRNLVRFHFAFLAAGSHDGQHVDLGHDYLLPLRGWPVLGVEIGKKHKLPRKILEFISTHHGTSTVQYFYRSFIHANPDEEVDIDEFRVPMERCIGRTTLSIQ